MLVLAFLAANDSRLKAEVIDAKGLLTGLIKGLSEDPEIVINHVLVGLYEDVITDRSIGLEARRSIFDENSIVEVNTIHASTAMQKIYFCSSDSQTIRSTGRG